MIPDIGHRSHQLVDRHQALVQRSLVQQAFSILDLHRRLRFGRGFRFTLYASQAFAATAPALLAAATGFDEVPISFSD